MMPAIAGAVVGGALTVILVWAGVLLLELLDYANKHEG
jgi:hypothetical protein